MAKKAKLILILICALQLSMSHAQWEHRTIIDEMTDEVITHLALSAETSPTKKMQSPYEDTVSYLTFSCDGKDGMFTVGIYPNLLLTEGAMQDGHEVMTVRIRIDDEVSQVKLVRSKNSDNILFFDKPTSVVADLASAYSVKLELNWQNIGFVYFEYDLEDATEMMKKAVSGCEEMRE